MYTYKAVFILSIIHKLHTRENKDEEGTDPSDDTDDFTHVGNIHGDEKSDGDPDHGENDSATTLKSLGDDSPAIPPEAHHQVQDDRPDPRTHTKSTHEQHNRRQSTVVCLTSPGEE